MSNICKTVTLRTRKIKGSIWTIIQVIVMNQL